MSITGAIESGIKGNHSILMVKSLIDGTTAIVFATSMGAGVLACNSGAFISRSNDQVFGLLQNVLSQPMIRK